MNIYHDINEKRITPDKFIAVVEIPKGAKKKYELDKETGLIILDRILYTSTHYPANYGFIPKTLASDNDPLDVLILCQEILEPMSLVECVPIGVIKMIDNNEKDEKIIAVPLKDPEYNQYKDINELPNHVITEMSHFFKVYKELEGKKTFITKSMGHEEAKKIIKDSLKFYQEKFKK